MRKRYFILLLAIALLLCSCASKPEEDEPNPSPTADEKTEDVIICKVNDSYIMRSDYEPVFNMYYQYYSMYVDLTEEETLKEFQNFIFDNLLNGEVVYQRALSEGIELTQDEESSILKATEDEYNALLEQAKSEASQEGAADIDARAVEIIQENYLDNAMTIDGYKEKSAMEKRKALMMEKLNEKVMLDVTYSEQEAQTDFINELEEQRKSFTENPAEYETALSNYQSQGGTPPLFIPEGYVRVKHILVATEEESNDMYARLTSGEDFEALMAEFGTDPGMQREPEMSEGYLMGPGTAFDPRFKEAGFKLENIGDISEPFESSYGYGWHIVKLIDIVESREHTFAELKDEYMTLKLGLKRDAYFAEQLQKWIDEADITSYIGRIRDLGKVS